MFCTYNPDYTHILLFMWGEIKKLRDCPKLKGNPGNIWIVGDCIYQMTINMAPTLEFWVFWYIYGCILSFSKMASSHLMIGFHLWKLHSLLCHIFRLIKCLKIRVLMKTQLAGKKLPEERLLYLISVELQWNT